MRKKKALYIGHVYHKKTHSTDFLQELLEESYDVDYCSYDPYTGEYQSDEWVGKTAYDYLICFQIMPVRIFLDKEYSYKKGILFPMYDATVELDDEGWTDYKDFLIISFSKKLSQKLQQLGIENKYIQFFPEPCKKFEWGEKDAVFFWQRRENLSLSTLNCVLMGNSINHIKLHVAMDPEQKYIQDENSLKAEIIKSDWFEKKESLGKEMESCSLYMASRRYEGIGMGFLEAMAMGRCVIAPNESTMNEYIQDGINGYLYDFESKQSIKLKNIREIQKNAYKTIEEGYKRWIDEKKNIIKWIDECIPTPQVTVFTYIGEQENINGTALLKCIESVHEQDYGNIEYVIINECQDEKIVDLLNHYADMNWLRVVKGANRGKYGEYGQAICQSTGFYIMFLDNTSYFSYKNSISEYVSNIQSKNYDYCYSNCKLINQKGHTCGVSIPVAETLFADSAYDYQAAIYKAYVLKHEGVFSGNYFNAGDFELECKLFIRGYKAFYLSEDGVTTVLEQKNTKRKKELIKIYSDFYGLETEIFYSQLEKLAYNRILSKDIYKHIQKCIQSDMADRAIVALREINEEYEVIASQVICSDFNKETEPLVTIVTVTFNVIDAGREKTFRQCIESIHNQTYQNIEHLIVDGASQDGTLDIIKEYENKGWLHYISEPDNGVWDAMRKGMKEASGKYINYLNTDDFFSYNYSVELAIRKLENENADYFFSLANRIEKDSDVESVRPLLDYYGNEDTVWWGKGMCHQSMYVKTDLMRELDPFGEDIEISMDNYMMLQLVERGKKAAYIDKPLVTFRMGGLSAVENVQDIFAKYFFRCCGSRFGMTLDECKSIWMLKCLNEQDIVYNLEILKKLDKKRWREYFAEQLSEKILEGSINLENIYGSESNKLLEEKRRLEKRSNKFTEYFKMYNLWMKKNRSHIRISDYLEKQGIGIISIYGIGELGERLFEDLEASKIKISYAVDRNTNKNYHNIPVVLPEQASENVQMIIVTPIMEYEEIKEKLKQIVNSQIVSLKDIIYNM